MNRNQEKYSKLQWESQQEHFLKTLKEDQGLKSWKAITSLVNAQYPNRNRNGKQCRERYMNYVRFDHSRPKILFWGQQDDMILFDKFLEFGAKWVQISEQIPGRSQNCLKNRFYGALRRVIRKINKVEKDRKLKYKKSIKYDSLMRILSYRNYQGEIQARNPILTTEKQDFVEKLRKDIIMIATNQEENTPTEQVYSLITRVYHFNCLGRVLPLKKPKQISSIDDSIIVSELRPQENSPSLDKISSQETIEQIQPTFNEQNTYEQKEESFVMQLINENTYTMEKSRDLEQELCDIFNEKYAPEIFPFFFF